MAEEGVEEEAEVKVADTTVAAAEVAVVSSCAVS